MEVLIDVDRLRKDLKEYYGAGAFSGMPEMMIEVIDIDRLSDEAVVRKAQDAGVDLKRYII